MSGNLSPNKDGTASKRRAKPKGPEVRETFLHRRKRMIKVDVSYIEELTEYSKDELVQLSIGTFLLGLGVSLFAEELIQNAKFTSALVSFFFIALAGGVVSFYGWRTLVRKRGRLNKFLETVEDETDA